MFIFHHVVYARVCSFGSVPIRLYRYCRIHNTISIGLLAEKLDMDKDHAEEWVVALIRNARLDAKIDSKAGHVLMTPQVCVCVCVCVCVNKSACVSSLFLYECTNALGSDHYRRVACRFLCNSCR